MKKLLTLLLAVAALSVNAQKVAPLIPFPEKVYSTTDRTVITLDAIPKIVCHESDFEGVAASWDEYFRSNFPEGESQVVINIGRDGMKESPGAYAMFISSGQINVFASDPAGVFYALQTLRQLIFFNSDPLTGVVTLKGMIIGDMPQFSWRGLHLDVSRHFYSVDYLKKHIDRMAFYKFNKLHLHLSDDEGWRIEIDRYPLLTEKGAWRTLNGHDRECMRRSAENPDFELDPRFLRERDGITEYGGFFTKDQMREIIAYAAERNVEIIPEIDMPGHMMAAILAYPELIEGDFSWGEVFSKPLAVWKPQVREFCCNVLGEIAELFPSEYVHVGADEVEKRSWEESELCRKFMEKQGLENVNQLQSWFIHEMQKFLAEKGKRIIAWDEILDGGTNSETTVMYWRGWVRKMPQVAVGNGNRVIMTPTNPLYFDYEHNDSSLETVYMMDIVYPEIPADKQHLIIGVQANLWAEHIPTERRAEYQLYPRLLALSDRAWGRGKEWYEDFLIRLDQHYSLLDEWEVNYRMPGLKGMTDDNVFVDDAQFFTGSPIEGAVVRYTTDGSLPTAGSAQLISPLEISEPVTLKLALFSPSGNRGDIYTLPFRETVYCEAVVVADHKPGLGCGFYRKYFNDTSEMVGQPDSLLTVSAITVPLSAPAFGLRYEGYIKVPQTGIYSFYLTSDDGSVLYLASHKLIDNDGLHSSRVKSAQIALKNGLHPFRLDFFEGGGCYNLKLLYSIAQEPLKEIPEDWFFH